MASASLNKKALANPSRVDFSYIDALARKASAQSHAPVVVHYISDNAGNTTDTAPLEIVTRLEDVNAQLEAVTGLKGPRVQYHNIPSQDTFAAAFDLAQASRGAVRGFGNVYFVNCAPRKKQAGVKKKNGGEKIYAGILPNGAIVAGTGEDAFAHFKDLVQAGELRIYEANVQTDKSQFRSRDIFPYFAQILGWHVSQPEVQEIWNNQRNVNNRDQVLLGLKAIDPSKSLALEDIPDLPNNGAIVQRRDVHLNAKTGLRHDDIRKAFRNCQDVVIYARGGEAVRAKIVNDSFEKSAGVTVISAGSSGRWLDAKGKKMSAFAEVFTVNDKAINKLGVSDDSIRVGAELHIIPAHLFDAAQKLIVRNHRNPQAVAENHTDIAKAIVDRGWVNGLDYSNLKREVINARRRKNAANFLQAKAA